MGGEGRRVGREKEELLKPRRTPQFEGDPAECAARAPPNYHLVVQFALTMLHMALKRRAGGSQVRPNNNKPCSIGINRTVVPIL